MDILLQDGQPLDILGVHRQKRIEQGFVRAGGVEPALDAEPVDQFV